MLKRIVIAVATFCLKTLYHICRLFPMRDRIVCISRQSDSAPLDFQLIANYYAARKPPVETIILARQLHNPLAYLPEMIRQVFFIATSRAVVLDSYCIVVSLLGSTIKTPVIQIWHALGNMKKFGYTALSDSSEEGRSPETARLLHMHEGYDAIAISSLSFRDDFAAGFNVDPSILFEAPLPRTDLFVSNHSKDSRKAALVAKHPSLANKQIIVYCPTFRRVPADNTSRAIKGLIDAIDFSRYGLIYKPHPVSDLVISDPRVTFVSSSEQDPLLVADYIISDYSTVIYEAGLLEIPVFLYAYDWNTYHQKRGLNIDIEHDVPTLFTDNPVAIMEAIERNTFDHRAYRQFMERNVTLPTRGTCTEQLCEKIIALAEMSEE